MKKKICFKCNKKKPLNEFYKHNQMKDGHLNKCKICTKIDNNLYRHKNTSKIRAYDKERQKRPERRKAKLKYNRNWRKRNPEKYAAHNKLNNAIRDGKIEKGPCKICGVTEGVEAHHDDYSRPFDVRWHCSQHHHDLKGE